MLPVFFGFTGSLIFGGGDFFGGLASKRISSFLATGIAALTGIVLLALFSLGIGGSISPEAVIWGMLSGLFGSLAILLLYAALAIGPMSILSPLGALVSAVIPVAWALFITNETLLWFGYIALGIGALAIVLIAFTPEKDAIKPTAKGLTLSIVSGVLIGLFLIALDNAPGDAGLYPLIFNRVVNVSIMFSLLGAIWLVRKMQKVSSLYASKSTQDRLANLKKGIQLAVVCGVLDATGNALLLLGIQTGNLSVMSVLTAMYPAGTIILAALVLREKITKLQLVGMVLALTAAALLALS